MGIQTVNKSTKRQQPANVNNDGDLVTSAGLDSIAEGRKVVASGGTAEALASSTPCKQVTIMAETDNTNKVVVGGAGVIASLSTREGIPLSGGQSITLAIDNLDKIYLDVETNGEGVTYLYQ